MFMKNKKLLSKNHVRIMITAGAVYAAAVSSSCCFKRIINAGQKEEADNSNARCPVCDSPVLKTDKFCETCGSHFHACPSCGTLIKDTYSYCKICGMENETAKCNYINGKAYPVIRKEPDSKLYVTYEYCSCGTPFEEDAKYCQFCGKIRPKKDERYMRKDIPS